MIIGLSGSIFTHFVRLGDEVDFTKNSYLASILAFDVQFTLFIFTQMGVGPDGIAVGGVDPAAQGVPGSDGGDEQVTETVTVETSSVPPHHHIVHHHQSGIQDTATGGKIISIVVHAK